MGAGRGAGIGIKARVERFRVSVDAAECRFCASQKGLQERRRGKGAGAGPSQHNPYGQARRAYSGHAPWQTQAARDPLPHTIFGWAGAEIEHDHGEICARRWPHVSDRWRGAGADGRHGAGWCQRGGVQPKGGHGRRRHRDRPARGQPYAYVYRARGTARWTMCCGEP